MYKLCVSDDRYEAAESAAEVLELIEEHAIVIWRMGGTHVIRCGWGDGWILVSRNARQQWVARTRNFDGRAPIPADAATLVARCNAAWAPDSFPAPEDWERLEFARA